MPVVGSFLKGIFFGHIEEELLFPYPRPRAAEREAISLLVESLRVESLRMIDPARIDEEGSIPPEVLAQLRPLGLFGLSIPTRFGGMGLSTTSWARVLEELARIDAAVAVTIGTHISLGTQGLLQFGSEAQKAAWLPRLATGEVIAAFALTEAEAGSDVAAIRCQAEPTPDGGYRLHGTKVNITNGGLADLFTVFARINGIPGEREGITTFLVPRGPGLTTGKKVSTLGVRGSSTTDVFLDGVKVEPCQLLGPVGSGFKIAMEILNRSRLAVAAGSVGLCQAVLDVTVDYTRKRRAFGQPIGKFGMIQAKLGQMAVDTFVMESLAYLTTGLIDAGRTDTSMECAAAKVYASETAWRVVIESLKVAGGAGYLPGLPFERLMRDARANLIFNGTNEILRIYIALAGLSGPVEFLRSVSDAVRRPLRSVGLLADYALAVFNRRWKRDTVSLAHERIEELADPLSELVARLGEVSEDLLRRHGQEIVHCQQLQERLANITIDLYASFAALSRTSTLLQDGDQERSREALTCTSIFVAQASRRIRAALAACERNEDV
ncbi:MAG: acyl-CoA dehydrogenase, partial [Deltaproteobacteria bacterium]|nr:acyl-CoA dehydrogenase [Deltaproteobacteria bacterium]